MIYKIFATNPKNETIEMELTRPDKSGLNVKSVTGITPIGADIFSTPFGVVDGGLYSGSRIPSRDIVLTIGMYAQPGHNIEDSRMILYNYFRIKDPVKLAFLTDTRYIEIEGYVQDNDCPIFSKDETATVTVRCVDPYFYSPYSQATGFSGVKQLFEFPFSNESLDTHLIEFGNISVDTRYAIDYEGDITVGFRAVLTFRSDGFHNIYIYNMDTRERLTILTDQVEAVTGKTLQYGDTLYLTTTPRNLSLYVIRDGVAYNAIAAVSKDSDWLTISKGHNVFAFASDYGVENIYIDMSYQNVYAGV